MPDTSTEVALATTTLGSAANTITFSSISSAYTNLRLVLTGSLSSSVNGQSLYIRFNSDTGSNYSDTNLLGTGTAASSYRSTTATYIAANGNFGPTYPAFFSLDVFSYTGSTNKTSLLTFQTDNNGGGRIYRGVGLWRSASAITSIDLIGASSFNFTAGTTATLYGIL